MDQISTNPEKMKYHTCKFHANILNKISINSKLVEWNVGN